MMYNTYRADSVRGLVGCARIRRVCVPGAIAQDCDR